MDQAPLRGRRALMPALEQVPGEQMARQGSPTSGLLLTLALLEVGARAELLPTGPSSAAALLLPMRLPEPTIMDPCQTNRPTAPSVAEQLATSKTASPIWWEEAWAA